MRPASFLISSSHIVFGFLFFLRPRFGIDIVKVLVHLRSSVRIASAWPVSVFERPPCNIPSSSSASDLYSSLNFILELYGYFRCIVVFVKANDDRHPYGKHGGVQLSTSFLPTDNLLIFQNKFEEPEVFFMAIHRTSPLLILFWKLMIWSK